MYETFIYYLISLLKTGYNFIVTKHLTFTVLRSDFCLALTWEVSICVCKVVDDM